MPYIKEQLREELNERMPTTAGELNYEITQIILNYWRTHGNYQGINDILGVLEGAKLEFYRRIAEPYENTKIEQNGDVYR